MPSRSRNTVGAVLAIGAFLALVPSDAFAYLDAGSASLIFQTVLGALLAVGIVLKAYWHRMRTFLGLAASEPDETGEGNDPTS